MTMATIVFTFEVAMCDLECALSRRHRNIPYKFYRTFQLFKGHPIDWVG